MWHVFLERGDPRAGLWLPGSVKRAALEDDSRLMKTQVVAVGLKGNCSCRCACGSTQGSMNGGGGGGGAGAALSNVDGDGEDRNDSNCKSNRSGIAASQSESSAMDLDSCANEPDEQEKEVDSAMLDEGLRLFYGKNAVWKSEGREQREGM